MFVWATLIYDPIACWTWNPHGWVAKRGGLDFAGGTPVHISSGAAALAYSYMLGKRHGHGTQELNYRPHNVTHIVIGTVFLWVGWFGFNAGSALGANLRAVMAAVVTNLAACVGGITWCLVDYRLERKWSAVGFCSGVIAGLVAITPASGYVPAWSAVVFGVVGGIACNYATKLKYFLRCDDALDIFAVHGIGGLVGNILTGIFAAYVPDPTTCRCRLLTLHLGITLPISMASPLSKEVGSTATGFRSRSNLQTPSVAAYIPLLARA
jgi:ammonium transporter, Amt family